MVKIKNCLIFLSVFILLNITVYLKADERILAIVNNEIITSGDLEDFVNFMRLQWVEYKSVEEIEKKLEEMKPELLEKLIEDRLILQEAKQQKIQVDKSQLNRRIDEIRKRYPSDRDFQRTLNAQGLTLADVEKRIQEQMLIYNAIERNVKSKVIIHPQEVTSYYQAHLNDFVEPEKRELVALVFNNQSQAEYVLGDLEREGIDRISKEIFFELKELGAIAKGQLKKELEQIIFDLKEGQYSQPIKIQDKYYIFFIRKINPSYQISLLQAKQKIYDILFEKRMNEILNQWLYGLRRKSYVQIKED